MTMTTGRRASPGRSFPRYGWFMTRQELTERILDIKREKGWSW